MAQVEKIQLKLVQSLVSEIALRPVLENELLISDRVLDSLGLVELIYRLEDVFGVRIDQEQVSVKTFDRFDQIVEFLEGCPEQKRA